MSTIEMYKDYINSMYGVQILTRCIRVRKNIARRAYNSGSYIAIIPHKIPINTGKAIIIHQSMEHSFDELTQEYTYSTCTTNQTGRYLAYYIVYEHPDNYFYTDTASKDFVLPYSNIIKEGAQNDNN